ncbi:MAG: ribose 5-phosphate isomerase A [Solirubrobacterales bacterium]|nr:ribose 5-phosphate isomerase A [Solirubrobacterales bacterium]
MEAGHDLDNEKRLAAEAAAQLAAEGMVLGLGTGSTVAHLLPAIAARGVAVRCVSTSPRTEDAARKLGIEVEAFDRLDLLDLAIDGADQIAADGWLVKGGGAAHTREKIVAGAAERFVVIADSSKPTERLAAPVPLELHRFGLAATLRELGPVEVRDAPPSPDGGVIADYTGEVGDPAELAERLAAVPGVVQHGLFPAAMVSEAYIGRGDSVQRMAITPPGAAADAEYGRGQ